MPNPFASQAPLSPSVGGGQQKRNPFATSAPLASGAGGSTPAAAASGRIMRTALVVRGLGGVAHHVAHRLEDGAGRVRLARGRAGVAVRLEDAEGSLRLLLSFGAPVAEGKQPLPRLLVECGDSLF